MLDSFLDWFERHKTGVIGSLLIHTFVLFGFAFAALNADDQDERSAFLEVDVEQPPPEQFVELESTPEEQTSTSAAGEIQNLTSNITAKAGMPSTRLSAGALERINNNVEQDVRAFEKSEFDRLAEERKERGEEITMPVLDPSKWNKEKYMEKAAEPVKIQGATMVWHDLTGRVREDNAPGYKCKGQGRVAVKVQVGRNGSVEKAEMDPAQSSQADDCMIEEAMRSARSAQFDRSSTAPEPQRGTVWFVFVRQ